MSDLLKPLIFQNQNEQIKTFGALWKRNNDLFTLSDLQGKVKVYDLRKGNWFPVFSFNESIVLTGKYEKVSGGDYGNGLLALFQSEIVFLDGSHVTHSKGIGVSSYSSNTLKTSKNSGNYRIEKNTIELNGS